MATSGEVGAVYELVGGGPRGGRAGGVGGVGGGGAAAIALIELRGDVDAALERAGIRGVLVGNVGVRDLAGIDHGVIARWTVGTCTIMPHAGPEVVRRLMEHLDGAGIGRASDDDVRAHWPEARSLIEARVLAALARTESTRGVEALLKQAEAWAEELRRERERRSVAGEPALSDEQLIDEIAQREAIRMRSVVMNRLITPPTVVALGAPNIGKSSLVNALAGRGVSLIADSVGTTRDHVGVTLDLGGLAVRWLDLPGITQDEWLDAIASGGAARTAETLGDAAGTLDDGGDATSEGVHRESIHAAMRMVRGADLLVLCGDATQPALDVDTGGSGSWLSTIPRVRVHLRADLLAAGGDGGRASGGAVVGGSWASNVRVSLRDGGRDSARGLEELVSLVRESLVPTGMIQDARAWRFW